MKRAAIIIIAVATLVLIGYPSAPSLADSANSINTGKSTSSGTGTAVDRTLQGGGCGGGGNTGGGTDQGDADGLSGLKGGAPLANYEFGSAEVTRVMAVLQTWWKFMLLSR